MSVVYVELDGTELAAAMKILAEHGIKIRNPLHSVEDHEMNCMVLSYRRLYSMQLLRATYSLDTMVEYEVRRASDAWRDGLRKLIVEAVTA